MWLRCMETYDFNRIKDRMSDQKSGNDEMLKTGASYSTEHIKRCRLHQVYKEAISPGTGRHQYSACHE